MLRILTLWFFMGILVSTQAQTVTVTDSITGQALGYATISSEHPRHLVITDINGKADVSAFQDATDITVRMVGYRPLSVSYAELQQNVEVRLSTSVHALNEVLVSAYQDEDRLQTSIPIEPLDIREMERQGSFNLTDALARVPGISQFSTGLGVSKPVVRGLYGNRILVLFSGLRFDNQQWQDEHGLGLSDMGISKVEVIKGPLSILYGTDAVGGVINIIEEQPPAVGTWETDLGMEFHSNTFGGTLQAGTKANFGNKWFRLRVGTDNHADYTDGNGTRVLNSRFEGYYLKASFGFQRKNWKSENHYHFSYNNFGFIFNDILHFMEEDARWSRKQSGPHHIVMLNVFSTANDIRLKNSILRLNTGFQSNMRSEDEGGGELSLEMHLLTVQHSTKWNKQLGHRTQLVVANYTSMENNTNYGRRKIVPDAWMAESVVSVYLKHHFNRFMVEYGVGGGFRHIKTLLTSGVNSEEKEIDPFAQTRGFGNGLVGISYSPNSKWNMKLNAASGVRAPNLAELSSNGLHEGVYTYEIGDPNMKNERNMNVDGQVSYSSKCFQASVSGFYNQFFGYIFLEPTDEKWFGFPVYRFRQHDAFLYGGEAMVSITPPQVSGLRISASYAGLIGKLNKGEFLPWMPAQKIRPEVAYNHQYNTQWSFHGFVNSDLVLPQKLIYSSEASTPSYQLLNAGFGAECVGEKVNYELNLVGNNLLNQAYYDHLSRLKLYGTLNMGWDLSINLKIKFKNK
ncbi:MAG: TonB-dependent receptor [Flavobacteriales bacterium]|nr:TonB-dependent receptor [Flavobacteriales bacterium]